MNFTEAHLCSFTRRSATRFDCEQLVLLQYTIRVRLVGTCSKNELIISAVLPSGSETASGMWPASYRAESRTSSNSASPAATSGLASRQ